MFFFGSLSSFSRNSIYSIHYTYYSLAVSGLLSTFFLCLFLVLNQCALFSVNSKYNLVVFSLLCFVLHFDSSFFGFWYFVLSAFFVVFVSSLGLLYSFFFIMWSSFLCWFSLRYAVLMFTSFIFTLLLFMWINDILLEGVLVFSRTEQFSLIFGIKLLILSEFMLFFCLFWTEINFRFILNVFIFMLPLLSSFTFAIPYTNVIVLLFSSLPIQATLIFYKVGLFFSCVEQLGQTVSCGTVFLVLQLKEFFYSFHSIADSLLGSVFYFTTGLHGAHVLFGLFYFWLILFLYCAVLFSWYNMLLLNMLCYVAFFFDECFFSFLYALFLYAFYSMYLFVLRWIDVLIKYFLTSLPQLNIYSRALYYMLFALPNMLSLFYVSYFYLYYSLRFFYCFLFLCCITIINASFNSSVLWALYFSCFFFLCIINSFSFSSFFACFFFSFSYLALTLAIDTLVFSFAFIFSSLCSFTLCFKLFVFSSFNLAIDTLVFSLSFCLLHYCVYFLFNSFYCSTKSQNQCFLFVFYYYLRWFEFLSFNLRWFYYCFYFLFNFSCFNCFYHKRKSFIVFACFYSFAQSFTQFSTYFFVEFSESLFYSSYYWHFVDIIWLVVFILYFFLRFT